MFLWMVNELYNSVEYFFPISRALVIFIDRLFEIDFETNVNDKSFIEEQSFELAIMASLSSSNNESR